MPATPRWWWSTPGWGDAVQANKAGLMEIADVFVVNKADRRTKDTVRELNQMLEMSTGDWKPEVIETIATKGEGIDDLWDAIDRHRAYQAEGGLLEARRLRRVGRELREIVGEHFRARLDDRGDGPPRRTHR